MDQPRNDPWETAIIWSAGDIRQYAYCPRVAYFRYAMPLPYRQTHTMKNGMATEESQLMLSRRRSFQRWGLTDAKVEPHPYWRCESLRLAGIPDAALWSSLRLAVVEFKDTLHGLTRGTKLQLAAYELLAGELFRGYEKIVLFHDPRTGRTSQVSISHSMRQEVLNIRDQLDDMILSETMPDPTPDTAKCVECEYRRSCGDVLL